MLLPLLVLAFSLLVGLAGLAACAWVIVTGQAFTLDGLLVMAISLTVGAIFAANVAWAWHVGEVGEVLQKLRPRSEEAKSQGASGSKGNTQAAN